ncbi:uncharacterized protein LOC117296560 [Asterias rubens]|uniref:uncharacterized protein LOC117296560 n=1 Tax=Asterias rubens TaxID=7604 RepID=UPI0014553C28|nr:uncharacterized protein LOC117296560 [Asterias rubens]
MTLQQRKILLLRGICTVMLFIGIASGQWDCYDPNRKEYQGSVSTACTTSTVESACMECLQWQTVLDRIENPSFNTSVVKDIMDKNYCRFLNKTTDMAPKCFFYNKEENSTLMTTCYIPPCDAHAGCMKYGNSSSYRDAAMFTAGGYRCLPWVDRSDQPVNPKSFPAAGLEENYCRNPNNSSKPWCYYLDQDNDTTWDYCDIPFCNTDSLSHFNRSVFATLDLSLGLLGKQPSISNAEECAKQCLDERDFTCRSFIFNEIQKHFHHPEGHCYLTNLSVYMLEMYPKRKHSKHYDLFTRLDTVCDAYEEESYPASCPMPLGMVSGAISNDRVTASSWLDDDHTPGHARVGNYSSWRPEPSDTSPWLEIGFNERMLITGLLIQGGGQEEHNWVKTLNLRFGNDYSWFWTYNEYRKLEIRPAEIKANGEPSCIKPIYLDPPIRARYLEISPKEYYGAISLRVEVLGCRDNDCDLAAGLARGDIHSSEITASSSVGDDKGKHGPSRARLNPFGAPKSGWMPSMSDAAPWLQVFLPSVYQITGVITQGCGNIDGWTADYTIKYSQNRSLDYLTDYAAMGNIKVFPGNKDRNTAVRNDLHPPIHAKVLRIYPRKSPLRDVCLRLELIGCKYRACGRRLGMESGFINATQISESSKYTGQDSNVGRLHHVDCWKPNGIGDKHWIQVDLLELYTITGLITQGGYYDALLGDQDMYYWPDSYRILYTSWSNHSDWRSYYNIEGDVMDFPAYPDPHTETRHDFDRPFITRKLRINPKSWRGYCLRLEILGCVLSEGQVCGESSLRHDGYCVGSVNTQSNGSCDVIFAEKSQPITVNSLATQRWMAAKRDDIKVNDRHYQYKIGLKTKPGEEEFSWADGTPMTYNNFRWPTNITNNASEWCVYIDMNDDLKWREFECKNDAVPRATICELDINECRANSQECSHTCYNFPGGFQCLCPRGFRLDNMNDVTCTTLCDDVPPPREPANSSSLDCTDPTAPGCFVPQFDFGWDFLNPWQSLAGHDEGDTGPTKLPAGSLVDESVCTNAGDVRCEEMWARGVQLEYVYEQHGYIHSLSFPPWYNQGSKCEINIQLQPGRLVRLEIHEMVLRRQPRTSRCIDVLNVTDHLTPYNSMSRGSFCGELQSLVIISRSNNVTLRLDIGAIGQDMPKKLGFMASYKSTDCTAPNDECDPGCGKKDVMTSSRGNFSTNDFPSRLPPFSICVWNISLPTGSYIALNFSQFIVSRTEDKTGCADYLQIFVGGGTGSGWYDKSDGGHAICGSTPSLIVSNSSSIQVVFRTGLDSKSLGFQAQYESRDIPGCGIGYYTGEGIQLCDMSEAAIASVNYPEPYLAGTSSVWHIITRTGTYIELEFVAFDVPDPYGISNVQISDGPPGARVERLLAKLTNENPPRGPIRSSFNEMTLRFRGDGSVAGNGFYAEYRATTFIPEVDLDIHGGIADACGAKWSSYNGHCYTFREANQSIRWTDAQRLCTIEGAHLVSINDFAEMNFIHRLMTSEWLTNTSSTYIGLTYDTKHQQHRWVDGSPLSYADWFVPRTTGQLPRMMAPSFTMAPQPDGGALERCSQIILRDLHSTSHWHDVPCASTNSNQFICEKVAISRGDTTTEPAPLLQGPSTAVCQSHWSLLHGRYCVKVLVNRSTAFLNRCPTNSTLATALDAGIATKLPFLLKHVWGINPDVLTRFLIGPRGHGEDTVYDVMTFLDGDWIQVREQVDQGVDGAICAMMATVETPTCASGMFSCGSGECIHLVYVCDYRNDCTDGSDEVACSNAIGMFGYTCSDTSFRCLSGECISLSFYCDFFPHCDDGSDEASCSIVECTDSQFRCDSGQCISLALHCNLVPDCMDQSDELNCAAVHGGFQCYDGAWLPDHTHCDGTKDCPGNSREDEPTNKCEFFQCGSDQSLIQCNNGACADRKHICIYDFDQYGYQTGCRDVTHLRFCDEFECSNNTFKCPGSYCVPLHRRCDLTEDCPGGEDELGCGNFTCSGQYQCHKSNVCVTHAEVCDGVKHCPSGDDELFCEAECPAGCLCSGLSYVCKGITWNKDTVRGIPVNIRKLELSGIFAEHRHRREALLNYNISLEYTLILRLEELQQLAELDLSGNNIGELKPGMFRNQKNLYKLVLANNNITKLKNGTFEGLRRLQFLNLTGNPLVEIESGAFSDVIALPVLDLGGLNLTYLQNGVFKGLDALQTLDVSNNSELTVVDSGAFDGLRMTNILDIRGTTIRKVDPNMFDGLASLQTLYADKYLFCCLLDETDTCVAPIDEFSSCEDLMRNPILRVFIWILGFSALIGNAFVIIWRVRSKDREQSKKIQTFLILNLAVADLLMGVYMIIIASADLHYRSGYMIHAEEWQESIVCQMAGFISVLSSEASVFLLVLITTDRFLGVVFPFSIWRLHTKSARYAAAVLWLLALFLSLLPVVLRPVFVARFYGRSSVCLALPFTRTKQPGWQYSVVLFLGVNLLGFLVIFLCYFSMYIAIKRASKQCTRKRETMEEIKMATKMGIIVGTDFLCWMPIITMGLLSLSGKTTIPQEMYAWAAVFMLPVNSAANPYLYTISSLDRTRKKTRTSTSSPTWRTECTRDVSVDFEMVKYAKVDGNLKENQTLMSTVFTEQTENRVLPLMGTRGHAFMLRQYIATMKTPLGVSAVAAIENDLRRALDFLHKNGIAHGQVDEDFVAVDKEKKEGRIAFLVMRGEPLDLEDRNGGGTPSSADDEVPLLRRDNRQLDELLARLRGSH